VVRVDFDVLVLDAFLFEGDPDALNEGAEPTGVELERVLGCVGLRLLAECLGSLLWLLTHLHSE